MKKFFAEIEDNFCGLLLFVMAILTCINVFARYILHSSMPFVEELTCVGLVIISVGGAATAAKRGAHLGLTLFTDMMPKKAQIVCQIVGNLLGIAFGAVLVYFGFLMAQQETENNRYAVAGMAVWNVDPDLRCSSYHPLSPVDCKRTQSDEGGELIW